MTILFFFFLDNATHDNDVAFQILSEANLTAEVSLVALDVFSSYCIHFKDTLMAYNGENDVMESIFSLLMSFLYIPQSTSVSGHVFATLRSFINHFSCILFKGISNCIQFYKTVLSRYPLIFFLIVKAMLI